MSRGMLSGKQEAAVDPYHPLWGFPARIAWLPDGVTATPPDFYEQTKVSAHRIIEICYSVRDAVKYALDKPKPGLKPWIMTNAQVFSPDQVKAARVDILRQDREDASRS
jgi:hypothetical protein